MRIATDTVVWDACFGTSYTTFGVSRPMFWQLVIVNNSLERTAFFGAVFGVP